MSKKKSKKKCTFEYKRDINEKYFFKETGCRHLLKDLDSNTLEKKNGDTCDRDQYSKGYCRIHSSVILDRQKYFNEFMLWVNEDIVLNLEDFSYSLQKDLYKTFLKRMNKIVDIKRIIKIPEGELDFSDEEYKEIYIKCNNTTECFICVKDSKSQEICYNHLKQYLIKYYKLITIDLRRLLLNMNVNTYEKLYKDAYNEHYVKLK